MEKIYEFCWAAICAWLSVWLIKEINASTGMLSMYCVPQIIKWIPTHCYGISAKTVLFLSLFLIYWATGIHKIVGRIAAFILGWGVIIIVVGLAILAGYAFLHWLISML